MMRCCCSLVTQVHAFGNSFGQAGGEAFAQALESNTTLEEVSVGSVIVGSTVRLKSSGEMCTVTYLNGDSSVNVKKADGSTQDYVGREGKEQFDPIPAVLPVKQLRDNAIAELDFKNSGLGVDGGIMLAAVLKKNASVTKVSAILCANQLTTAKFRHAFNFLGGLQPSLPCVLLAALDVILPWHVLVVCVCTVQCSHFDRLVAVAHCAVFVFTILLDVTQVNVRDNRLDQKTKDLLSKTNKKVKFDV